MKVNNAALATLLMVLCALSRPALAGLGRRQWLAPCKRGQRHNCNDRFKPCGTHVAHSKAVRLGLGGYPRCYQQQGDPYGDVNFIVQFDGKDGCKEIYMSQGECW